MANFTPAEIEEILQQFFDVTGKRQYIGARYVPIFGRKNESTIEWDNLAPYESLTVVLHNGVSFVSKKYVPAGIDINDTEFWAETYRFNAQVEQYRQEVLTFDSRIATNSDAISTLEDLIPASDFDFENTVKDYIDTENIVQNTELKNTLVPFPNPDVFPKYGNIGQVLSTLADGTTKWQNPVVPSDAQAEEVITAWLNQHPEATTTVQDGSLTIEKLNDSLLYKLLHYEGMSSAKATDDFNNLLSNLYGNTYSWVDTSWFNDSPFTSGAYFVFTIQNGKNAGSNAYSYQIAFGKNGTSIMVRFRPNNGTYGAWRGIADFANMYSYVMAIGSATEPAPDLNDITATGFYYRGVSSSTIPNPNAPTPNAFVMRVDSPSSSITSQIVWDIGESFNVFQRLRIGANWGSWREIIANGSITIEKLNDSLLYKLLHYEGVGLTRATEEFDNSLSNLYGNTYSWVDYSWFNDTPFSSGAYFIITLQSAKNAGTSAYSYQIAIGNNGTGIYMRHRPNNGTYGNWSGLKDLNTVYSYVMSIGSATEPAPDLNDITATGFYYRGVSSSTIPNPNAPTPNAFVMRVDSPSSSITSQIVWDISENFAAYQRLRIGNNWSAWRTLSYKNANGHYYAFGDSTTKGQIGGGSGSTYYSYPRITANNLGMKLTNLAVGGQGLCKDWDTILDTIEDADMSDANLITIGWAYNDGPTWATMNRGNYQSNDDTTVIGRYFKIMEILQQKCPKAQVVLVTGYGAPNAVDGQATLNHQWTTSYVFLDQSCTVREFYDELEKMAHRNGWCCVNQANGCALNKYNALTLIGDQIHPTVEGYWVYGNNLAAQISKYYANIIPRGF